MHSTSHIVPERAISYLSHPFLLRMWDALSGESLQPGEPTHFDIAHRRLTEEASADCPWFCESAAIPRPLARPASLWHHPTMLGETAQPPPSDL
jgi:hypothetical protein